MNDIFIYLTFVPLLYFLIFSQSKTETIILIFISTYIISYILAYYLGVRIDVSSENDTETSNYKFILALYVFYTGYFLQKHFFRSKNFKIYKVQENKNLTFYLNILLITLFLIELSLTSFDIFATNKSYSNLTKDTYFFEFINIIYVFYVYNIGNKRSNFFLILVSLHCLLAIVDGHRLMAVTSFFLLFILYIVPKISKSKMIIYLFLGFVLLEGVSMLRSGNDVSFSAWLSSSNREESFSSHQGSVIYSTLSIMEFSERYDVLDKIIMSSEYTLSLFFSSRWLPDELIFSKALSKVTFRPGGGLIIGFAYAFFGYIGVFITGYFISSVLNWGRYFDKNLLVPPFIYLIIIMIPRYFSYTPLHIFKTILFTFLLYYLLYRSNVTKNNKKQFD